MTVTKSEMQVLDKMREKGTYARDQTMCRQTDEYDGWIEVTEDKEITEDKEATKDKEVAEDKKVAEKKESAMDAW